MDEVLNEATNKYMNDTVNGLAKVDVAEGITNQKMKLSIKQ